MFPQPTPPPSFFLAHAGGGAVIALVVGFGVVMLWPKRTARIWDGMAWIGLGFLLISAYRTLVSHFDLQETTRLYAQIAACLIAAAVCIGLIRLARQSGLWLALESVVAITVAVVFFAVLFMPPLTRGREEARFVQCKNNLALIGRALRKHHDDRGSLPEPHSGEPLHSWRVDLLPYLDLQPLHAEYRFQEPWDSPANHAVALKGAFPFHCPTSYRGPDLPHHLYADYALLTGSRTWWPPDGPQTWNPTQVGTAHTAMVVEACGQNIIWTEPRDIDVATAPVAINTPGTGKYDSPAMFSSWHHRGVHVLMSDGSVKCVSLHTDPQVLRAMIVRQQR